MSIGTLTKSAQSAVGTAGPFFFYLIAVVGAASYTSGGDDILTPLRAATKDDLQVIGIVPLDCGGYVPAYVPVPAALTSGNGTFALTEGMILNLTVNKSDTKTIVFHAAARVVGGQYIPGFANLAAATAAEVVAYINASITDVVATVSSLAVVLTSNGPSINVLGGTANTILGFSTTAAVDGGLLKVYKCAGTAVAMVEPSGSLASTTFNLLVIAR